MYCPLIGEGRAPGGGPLSTGGMVEGIPGTEDAPGGPRFITKFFLRKLICQGESRSCGCLVNIVWGVLHGGVMTDILRELGTKL